VLKNFLSVPPSQDPKSFNAEPHRWRLGIEYVKGARNLCLKILPKALLEGSHHNNNLESWGRMLGKCPPQSERKKNQDLMKPLTLEEIQQVITSLPWGKVPKGDGLPTEFF
jgi:hypothetical protein